ncbi:hypothetical protein DPMN_143818 [Dreissena polymorpha]|uniref:Uncharacterized protein n=1 Tax=Dreissena polymorpha TaxID=45954 RepID=A0A9D4GDI9_DREPO|nr:hypothetical protein DPMN_143818 [Dreissena polymorpha]
MTNCSLNQPSLQKRYRSVEEEPHASLQLPTLPTSSENVNQSSLPAFNQTRQVATAIANTNVMQPAQQSMNFHQPPKLNLVRFNGDISTWQ